jgi:clostripain
MTLEVDLEHDSADPEVLEKFVLFGKARFPAARYGLLIYSHANGQTMCPDDESGREMGIPELSEVVSDRASVDFLALELCNMGGIEIGYQWRPGTGRFGADVLLAIPNAGPPLDWHRAFDRIRSAGHSTDAEGPTLDPSVMTAADFGNLVIEEGARGRAEMAKNHPERAESVRFESAASYDLRKAAAVKKAVDALASTLAIGDPENAFEELRGSHSRSCAIRYTGSEFGAHPYVDLYDLASRAAESERLSEAVRSRAREAMAATDEFVLSSFGMDGLAGFEPGKSGVFLVYPTWQRLDWYVPRRAETGEAAFGGWSFLRDGASEGNRVVENWYELLGYWYETHDSY